MVRNALESVVSRPFKMVGMVGSPASPASSASSASSSSQGAEHTFVLPLGVVQVGRAVVAVDAFAFDASWSARAPLVPPHQSTMHLDADIR